MSRAGKGHVPEKNLLKYRAIARIARQFDALGNTLSDRGEHRDARTMWGLSHKYWEQANALRVDLPAT